MIQIFFLAVALGVDAFSVAVAFGLSKISHGMKFKISLLFGLFQFLFPLLGVFIGQKTSIYFGMFAKSVGAAILVLIALSTFVRAYKEEPRHIDASNLSFIGFLLIGVSVSVDALAVGFSLGMYDAELLFTALMIGAITFIMTFFGAEVGYRIGGFIGAGAEIIGGVLLLLVAGSLYLGLLGG